MKTFALKILVLLFTVFAFYACWSVFFKTRLTPKIEYISAMNLHNKNYLNLMQNDAPDDDSIIVEDKPVCIHSSIVHESEATAIDCQNESNTSCYVAAIAINANEKNAFLNRCLIEGSLPKTEKQIAITKDFAKRRNIHIGDKVCLKSSVLYDIVYISGIFKNLYGFDDFSPEKRFYFIQNRSQKYLSFVSGKLYRFSDSEVGAFDFLYVPKLLKAEKKSLIICFSITFLASFIIGISCYQAYKKILCLSKYHARLFSLGKAKSFVMNKRIKEVLFFSTVSFVLIVLSSFAGGGVMLALLNTAALILSSIINFLWSK